MQVMRRALLDLGLDETTQQKELESVFGPLFHKIRGSEHVRGGVTSSVVDIDRSTISVVHDLASATAPDGQGFFSTVSLYSKQGPFSSSVFSQSQIQHLTLMYQALLGEHIDGLQLVVPQMHTVWWQDRSLAARVGDTNHFCTFLLPGQGEWGGLKWIKT